jgi:decaprenylphospho-beta-D-erythro-pentofuranosid-2-ulose 2-reductase
MNDALGRCNRLSSSAGLRHRSHRAALVRSRCRTVVLAGRIESFAPAKERLALGATTVEASSSTPSPSTPTLGSCVSMNGSVTSISVLWPGVLGDQDAAEATRPEAARIVETNYRRSRSRPACETMRRQGHGRIVVLSSVAGERAQ